MEESISCWSETLVGITNQWDSFYGILPVTNVHTFYVHLGILYIKRLCSYQEALSMYKHSNDMRPSVFDYFFWKFQLFMIMIRWNVYRRLFMYISTTKLDDKKLWYHHLELFFEWDRLGFSNGLAEKHNRQICLVTQGMNTIVQKYPMYCNRNTCTDDNGALYGIMFASCLVLHTVYMIWDVISCQYIHCICILTMLLYLGARSLGNEVVFTVIITDGKTHSCKQLSRQWWRLSFRWVNARKT